MNQLKKCPICQIEDWENLDYLRDAEYWQKKDYLLENEQPGFKGCKNCGYVTYDYIPIERMQEIYDRERKVFNPAVLVTGNRKNQYHEKFLKGHIGSYFKILDVGTSVGTFLNFMHTEFNVSKENLYGTEWAKTLLSFGKIQFGFNASQEIDLTQKYDLVSYYHVLEHLQNPDQHLIKIRDVLNKDGLLYISIPVWFDRTEETSMEVVDDFEKYYHLNHISVFTKNSLKNLLMVTGFEIIKEDDCLYGYTVLCRKIEIDSSPTFLIDDIDKIKEKLETQKEAIERFKQKNYVEAIKLCPDYTDAYVASCVSRENQKEFELQKNVIQEGLSVMPHNLRLKEQMACILFQFDENRPDKQRFYSNNIRKAESIFLELAEKKPSDKIYYFLSLINGIYKKEYDIAIDYMRKHLEINFMNQSEALTLIAMFAKEIK